MPTDAARAAAFFLILTHGRSGHQHGGQQGSGSSTDKGALVHDKFAVKKLDGDVDIESTRAEVFCLINARFVAIKYSYKFLCHHNKSALLDQALGGMLATCRSTSLPVFAPQVGGRLHGMFAQVVALYA